VVILDLIEGLSIRLSRYGLTLVIEGFRRSLSLLGIPKVVKALID